MKTFFVRGFGAALDNIQWRRFRDGDRGGSLGRESPPVLSETSQCQGKPKVIYQLNMNDST